MPKAPSTKTTTPTSSPIKKEPHTESQPNSPSKPTKSRPNPWTGEDTYQLFQIIHPKPAEIPWKEICKQFPGKDQQACRNRYRKNIVPSLERALKGGKE